MDFSTSIEIIKSIVEAIMPFLIVATLTVVAVRMALKGLRGKL